MDSSRPRKKCPRCHGRGTIPMAPIYAQLLDRIEDSLDDFKTTEEVLEIVPKLGRPALSKLLTTLCVAGYLENDDNPNTGVCRWRMVKP